MGWLARLLGSTDPRAVSVVCLCVLMVTMGPHGVLSGNEEQYLAVAYRTVHPDSWPADSNLLGGFPHAMAFNQLMGHLIGWVGFGGGQAIGRALAIALYTVALVRLWRVLALSAGDLLFVLVAFVLFGESLVGNEWMFRGIEPKVPAYGFVLLALTALLEQRPGRCYLLLVAATYLHAFVGGFWAVIFTLALLSRHETRRQTLLVGPVAAIAVAPFVVFLLRQDYGQLGGSPPVAGEPSVGWILSYVAFPWHASPFADLRSIVRWTPGILATVLVGAGAWLARARSTDGRTRLLAALACLAAVWVMVALALTAAVPDGRLGAFVPFRPSALGFLVALIVLVTWVRTYPPPQSLWTRAGMLMVVIPAAVPVVLQMIVFPVGRDLLRAQAQRPMVEWVKSATRPDSVFVIEPSLEESFFEFERRTGRVNFFVHRFPPGGQADIREWYRRHQFRQALFAEGCGPASRARRFDYLIVPSGGLPPALAGCGPVVHRGDGFEILRHVNAHE